MFHSFHVVINDAIIEAEKGEKIRKQFVPVRDFPGQGFAGNGQNKAAIFFVFQQSFRVEPLHHVGHAGLRNF